MTRSAARGGVDGHRRGRDAGDVHGRCAGCSGGAEADRGQGQPV
jgi:hypothetical protein